MTDLENAADQIDDEIKEDRALAILKFNGETVIVRGNGLNDLRKNLRPYPSEALCEVWRGRKLPLKTQLRVTF